MKTLYLCYFGLREPLVQTQVLPYLHELAKDGIEVSLLTFEPAMRRNWSNEDKNEWQQRLRRGGINWHALSYHKRPSLPATLYDIAVGSIWIVYYIFKHQIQILHARAHIPLAMALIVKILTGRKVIFDIRGLVADEYVDAGIWQKGTPVYRVIKWLETVGIRKADQLVVLTESLKGWIVNQHGIPESKIEVIPCCVDNSKATLAHRTEDRRVRAGEELEIIYAGSVTGLYLFDEMIRFFLVLKKRWPQAFFRVLTGSANDQVKQKLYDSGLTDRDFWVGFVAPSDLPQFLSRAKVGLSFRKPTFSQIAASPTKVPEYLAFGIPVVANAGIGDTDQLLRENNVGVIIDEFSPEAYAAAVKKLEDLLKDGSIKNRCQEIAKRFFDLVRVGGARYLSVYQKACPENMR